MRGSGDHTDRPDLALPEGQAGRPDAGATPMTRTKLRLNVSLVSVALLLLPVVALLRPSLQPILKDFVNVFVAVAAAYLAFCFQRRQAFLAALRDLWQKSVEAKADLVDYTWAATPTREAFGKAQRSLSVAIDLVRGAYRNVGETERAIGFYPFEPLHDMRRALDALGFEDATPERQRQCREQVLQAWNAFRWCFLQEFALPEPRHAIIQFNAKDPRRAPAAR